MRAPAGLIGVCLALALGCAPTTIASDVPLQDRAVKPPGPDAPRELAAFVGRWVGTWTIDGQSYRKNMALILQEVVPPDRVIGFYGCGHASPIPSRVCPVSIPISGGLESGTLTIDYPAIQAIGRFRINGSFLEGELFEWNTGTLLMRVRAWRLP